MQSHIFRHGRMEAVPEGAIPMIGINDLPLTFYVLQTDAMKAVEAAREACARIAERQCDVYNIGNVIADEIRRRV